MPSFPTAYQSDLRICRLNTLPTKGVVLVVTLFMLTVPFNVFNLMPLLRSCDAIRRPESSMKQCASTTLMRFPLSSTISRHLNVPVCCSISSICPKAAVGIAHPCLPTVCPQATVEMGTTVSLTQTSVSVGKHALPLGGGASPVPSTTLTLVAPDSALIDPDNHRPSFPLMFAMISSCPSMIPSALNLPSAYVCELMSTWFFPVQCAPRFLRCWRQVPPDAWSKL